MDSLLKGRKIIIATKHQKEQVVAPLLNNELGLDCVVSKDMDTDVFGTFTGEIERLNNPIETARQKCLKAMELSGLDLAISSEGSFGLHPTAFFLQANSEVILLVDKKNKLEFIAREISTKTNFSGSEVKSYKELQEFAKSALFPSHGLILRKSKEAKEDIYKGITTTTILKQAYNALWTKYGSVYAETDMRAMYNPTRMLVIKRAVEKLITKIKSPCPTCNGPGFSVTEAKPGLKCENCGSPTRSTLLHILSCQSCGYTEEKLHPHGRFLEDPMYCDICNP
ncbi:MAG: hypothetical protein HY062_16975 [Bacteroidetes bacterium]|nr:hypothetical protein [Bacteroidota bacterium]